MKTRTERATSDRGLVLPLVLVVTVVLGLTVAALARYGTVTARYGQVTETRADRLAAADGAMRDAIERLRVGRPMCTTQLGSGGYGTEFPQEINGASATVTCQKLGIGVTAVTAWALVVTGEGVPDGTSTLESQSGNGQDKRIGGPVYVETAEDIDLAAAVRIVEGDLYHSWSGCPSEGTTTDLDINRLEFEPADVRSTICTKKNWKTVFGEAGPPLPDMSSIVERSWNDYVDYGGCRVFAPGKYTGTPQLSDGGNYFQSGDYWFVDSVFEPTKNGTRITAGFPDASANVVQGIPNDSCDAARTADPFKATPGATFYLDGSSRIDITKGAFEILPRKKALASGAAYYVAVQALAGSDLTWNSDPIVATKEGNNKEFSIGGLIWAPRAKMVLGNVTNDSVVAIRGGAVVANIEIGASASITGFVIEVPTSPSKQMLLLTSTAIKNGDTTIRAMVEYRPPKEVAVVSWRIVNES
jgi:Tfp pilus assembly protein PilX